MLIQKAKAQKTVYQSPLTRAIGVPTHKLNIEEPTDIWQLLCTHRVAMHMHTNDDLRQVRKAPFLRDAARLRKRTHNLSHFIKYIMFTSL